MSIIKFVTLLLMEISIGYVYFTDKLVKYIHPKYNIFVAGGLILTAILLLLILIFLFRSRRYSFKPDFSLILLFPVFLLLSDKGDMQSAKLIDNKFKGSINFQQFEQSKSAFGLKRKNELNTDSLKKDDSGYKNINIMQIYNLLNTVNSEKEIESINIKIETLGQLYRQTGKYSIDLYGDEFMLIRLVMICCAADIQPLGILVENKQKYDFNKFDDWLLLKGNLTFIKNPKGDGYIGYLSDDSIQKTDAPEVEWLYPDLSFFAQ